MFAFWEALRRDASHVRWDVKGSSSCGLRCARRVNGARKFGGRKHGQVHSKSAKPPLQPLGCGNARVDPIEIPFVVVALVLAQTRLQQVQARGLGDKELQIDQRSVAECEPSFAVVGFEVESLRTFKAQAAPCRGQDAVNRQSPVVLVPGKRQTR